MKTIQVFEHEKLTTASDLHQRKISQKQLDKLLEFNDRNKNKYFTAIRNGIKFNQYVGVIQIGSLTIEILPKTDKTGFENPDKTNVWRNVLLKMLSISGNINIESVSDASLRKRNNTLLDLYFEKYVKEIESLLHKGLVKKYRNKADNLNALKGRLDFSGNIKHNIIHKERFYTHSQNYDYEHIINQILIRGLRILSIISNGSVLTEKINKLLFNFPEIKEIEINQSSFNKVVLNRKTEKYSEALKIAKMLILNYSPDISKGQENMLALLFDMNDLWEKYIYKILKRAEDESYSVSYHKRKSFWETRYIEPDIILKKDNLTYIIDTKWKLISSSNPALEDLKQYVYNMYWDAPKSILLYPNNESQDGSYGVFRDEINNSKCKVSFVDVLNLDNDGLNLDVGNDIVAKL